MGAARAIVGAQFQGTAPQHVMHVKRSTYATQPACMDAGLASGTGSWG